MRFAFTIIIILAVALQWYAHAGRLLYTPDSCSYLAAVSNDFKDYTAWPPLFPIVLWLFGSVWYWMQLLIIAVIGTLLIFQIKKIIADLSLQILCFISIVLGVHLLMIGTFLWSELLFLLILMLFVSSVQKDQLILSIILGFLLCLQRHAGFFFVVGAALYYLDIKRSLLLFFISSSGFIAWNIYASVIDDNQYFHAIPHNFLLMSESLMHAIAPVPGFLLLLLLGGMFYFLRSDKNTRLLSILFGTYFFGMICLVKFVPDDIERFMAVIIPFFMILIFRTIEIATARQTPATKKLLIILIICWLAYPLSRSVKNAIQWHNLSFTSYFCPDSN